MEQQDREPLWGRRCLRLSIKPGETLNLKGPFCDRHSQPRLSGLSLPPRGHPRQGGGPLGSLRHLYLGQGGALIVVGQNLLIAVALQGQAPGPPLAMAEAVAIAATLHPHLVALQGEG